MDELFSIVFFGGLILCILFGPWILLWRSRTRQKREREEDQEQVHRLTQRIFLLENAVRKLSTPVEAAKPPSPQPEREKSPAAPPPVPSRDTATPPSADRVAAEAFVTKTHSSDVDARRTQPTPVATEYQPSAPLPSAPAFQSVDASSSFVERLKSTLDLEEALGTNWLNKIGVSILVLGIAFFLAYQIRTLGPAGKVLVGYIVSAVMLGAGIWFERHDRYRILARAGVGGGWALLFFVTYAMYHVAAARVLTSQVADLLLMLAVAGAMVWHTLRYHSQVVTSLALLLAFMTVTISHETVYSLSAGVVLAAALVIIVGRMQWFELEVAGIIASYLNHYLWLRRMIEPMNGKHRMFSEFFASAGILVAYWVIFRISYVVRRPENSKEENLSSAAALLNVACLLGLLKYQSVHPEWAFWALLAIGAVEVALGQLPMTRRRRAAVIVLSTLGTVFLIAAFPFRYSGARLSVLWLAEAEAIFLMGVWTREIVFRRIGMLATAVVAGQMIAVDAARVFGMRSDAAYVHSDFGVALLFAVSEIVFYGNAHWVSPRWSELFSHEFDRVFIKRSSYAACVLLWIGAWIAFPETWTAVSWCTLGLVLSIVGRRLQVHEFGYQGKVLSLAGVLRVLAMNFDASGKFHGLTLRLITVTLVGTLLYLSSRLKVSDNDKQLQFADRSYPYADVVGGFFTWTASFLLSLLAWYELRPVGVAVAWTMFGLLLIELGITHRSIALRLQGYVALVCGFGRIFFVNLNASGIPGEISPRFYTVVPVAIAFFYAYWRLNQGSDELLERERLSAASLSCYLGTASIGALMRFEIKPDWVAAAWAALVFAAVALAWRWQRRVFLHQALLLSFGVLTRVVLHNFYERSYFPAPEWDDRRLTAGLSVAFLFACLPFAFHLRNKENSNQTGLVRLVHTLTHRPEQVWFFMATGLVTVLLTLETRHGMVTLAWGLEALCVFMFALWVGERSFRLTGVALLLLCVGKILLVDVWQLQPRDRYMTLIVLGAALLLVSFMYTRYREAIRQYL